MALFPAEEPPTCKATFTVHAGAIEMCGTERPGDEKCDDSIITVVRSFVTGACCCYGAFDLLAERSVFEHRHAVRSAALSSNGIFCHVLFVRSR